MPNYLSPGVYMEEVSSGSKPIEGVGTAVAAFVGFAEKGPANEPMLVTNWTQFTQTFGGFVDGSYLAHAVYGYFLNGGGSAYVVRVGGGAARAEENGSGNGARTATAELAAAGQGKPLVIRARQAGPGGNDVTVEVRSPPSRPRTTSSWSCARTGQRRSTTTSPCGGARTTCRPALRAVEADHGRGDQAGALAAPAQGHPGHARRWRSGRRADRGGDQRGRLRRRRRRPHRLRRARGHRRRHHALRARPDGAYQRGHDRRRGRQGRAARDDRALRADGRPGRHPGPAAGPAPQQVKEWRMDDAGYDSKYAALYWPWIKVMDPAERQAASVPPSGHVAGIWARNDDTRGVHKAPANEVVRGVVVAAAPRSPRASTTSSTRSASTASGRSPARASGCGARAPCPATRSGATSTCGGCSTTSRSRS